VIGNPPYSGHSANKGDWIYDLMRCRLRDGADSFFNVDGKPLGERNPKWLNDDYVKFIRYGQSRIASAGAGILGFITNHSYLDNPTFRGMRQSLLHTFRGCNLLDLHGNIKKNETPPDGTSDSNVFDIQQGVAIGLFCSQPLVRKPSVKHADLWGTREVKYELLSRRSAANYLWTAIQPGSPLYLFIPRQDDLVEEYEHGWRITEIFPRTLLGPNSHRDHFAIAFTDADARRRIRDFRMPD